MYFTGEITACHPDEYSYLPLGNNTRVLPVSLSNFTVCATFKVVFTVFTNLFSACEVFLSTS